MVASLPIAMTETLMYESLGMVDPQESHILRVATVYTPFRA